MGNHVTVRRNVAQEISVRPTESAEYCANYGEPGTLASMREEGDEAQQEVQRVRAEFKARLHQLVIVEREIPEEKAAGYLRDSIGVRWATAKEWLRGQSFPTGANLIALARFLDVPWTTLVPPMIDAAPPPAFVDFLKTPEGRSLEELERWSIRLFQWAKPATVGDYRQLLALYRSNAER